MSDEVLDIFISVLSRLSPSQHSRGNAHTPRTRTSRSRCHQWTRQCQRRRRTAHPTAPRDARKMHLSAHEDGRQLALLDPHTKRYRSAPTKAIRMRFFEAIKRTQAGQECTKRPRSKRPRDARKTYLCGCWSAYCRSDIGLQPRTVCRCRSWSALRCKPCCCRCSNSSLSCKRGPADAGGVGVVNWPRRHRLRPARSRKKLTDSRACGGFG